MDLGKLPNQEKKVRCWIAVSRANPDLVVFVAARDSPQARSVATTYLSEKVRCEVSYFGVRAWRFRWLDWIVEDMDPSCFDVKSAFVMARIDEMVDSVKQRAEDLYYSKVPARKGVRLV